MPWVLCNGVCLAGWRTTGRHPKPELGYEKDSLKVFMKVWLEVKNAKEEVAKGVAIP